jgi:hypothetical protein
VRARRSEHWILLFLPLSLGVLLVALYFSPVETLRSIVAPVANREFGLLETIQHLLLLWIAVAAWGASRRVAGLDRWFWRIFSVGAAVVLLEEIDYGLHLYELFAGAPHEGVRNLHNQGNTNKWMKRAADAAIVTVFGLSPWLVPRRLGLERYVPHRLAVAPFLIGVFVSQTVHWLDEKGVPHNGSLEGNFSEFREAFVYYTFAAYVYLRRQAVPRAA